ncbi:MAG: hypothetical protein GY826_04245 [Fuerstiella sp.]|nr:hypothetical protein [Fuerstiella sp.]
MIARVVVFACSGARAQRQDAGDATSHDVALQQERVQLLAEGVTRIEAYVERELADRADVVQAQINLILVQLEYASSKDAKRGLFTELLAKYDHQIRLAEEGLKVPQRAPSPGEQPRDAVRPYLAAASRLLLLKSERIRVQIERDTLR